MVVFGDGIHNFIDGMSIGAGYSQSLATGLGLSLAIVCEEFPHELGDFAILVQSGMSVKRALFYNFLSACTAFLGLAVGLWLGQLKGANFIFAFAGGLFLYISLTHLMPELQAMLKEDSRRGRGSALVALALQNVGMIIGAGAIYTITTYNQVITGESPDV
ncbi:hypothetical protein AAG570_008516 [Ranatra chinensis]|uniref:Uncharacterized protein n=1 Tax=Ranatra chinensis TaxID=642074 RepID=A0ABD0YR72_9HEMI